MADLEGEFLVDTLSRDDIEQAINAGRPFRTDSTSLSVNPTLASLPERSFKAIAASIVVNPRITSFSYNSVRPIDPAGWSTLMKAFNRTNITTLTIEAASLKDNRISDLCQMLKSNKRITHLRLIEIVPNDYSGLSEVLAENTTLKSIDITLPQFSSDLGLESIEKGLRSNTTLEQLNFSSISRNVFEAICRGLHNGHKLKSLLFYNVMLESLSPECLVALHCFLETNKNLVKLTLKHCRIDRDAATAIYEGLTGSTLADLVLDQSTSVGNSGSLLTHYLKRNTSLKRLSMQYYVDPEGVKGLIEALLENNTLEWLDLSGCRTSVECYPILKKVIGQNTSLTHLFMSDNGQFDNKILKQLTPELQQNQSLQKVLFSAVNSPAMASVWCDILKENESLVNIGPLLHVSQRTKTQIFEYYKRNRQQQNIGVQNVIIILFNFARDPHALHLLPLELWFHVVKFIRIPGATIDWHNVFKEIFNNKSQLKVQLHHKYDL